MTPLIQKTSSNFSRLKEIKLVLRSLLISLGSRDVTLEKLDRVYRDEEGENIPYKDFNYTSLKEFLLSIPDVLHLEWNNKLQTQCVYHVDTEKSRHVSSLVAREKKKPSVGKNKTKGHILKEECNLVDPHLLLEVLKDLRSTNNRIKKQDILTEITKRIGPYSFYTMRGLNRQLSEFPHLLKHDSDIIYFKNKISENKTSTQSAKPKNQDQGNIINQNVAFSKSVDLDTISDFVNEKIQERLIKLIEKHPNGIWCSELPDLYVKEFLCDLQYLSMGFSNITEFVAALPHIFTIIVPPNTQKQMVVDARRDSNHLPANTLVTSTPSRPSENIEYESQPHPLKLSPKVTKSLIPENAMNCDETVDQICVSSLFSSSNPFHDVIVCDVHNPSFFWVMLRKNKKKLDKLMSDLQNFYSQQDLTKYKVAKAVLQPGLNIACTFADHWHRGIVSEIKPNGIEIHFYDYGTIYTYNLEEIYHLDKKFADLPAQAIPCSLYNVTPIQSNKWSSEYCTIFQKRVLNKAFVASLFSIDQENNSMTINLIDTSSTEEVYINEWMIKKRMAVWGKARCNKKNFAFQHYQKCLKIVESATNDKSLKIHGLANTISFINIDLTVSSSPTYIDSKKKLEAVKKYKAKRSSSLSSTSEALSSVFSSSTEDSASTISSASSISSITNLNNDIIDEKQDKSDSGLSDQDEEKLDKPKFSSKHLSSSQSSLFSTDSFVSNTSSDKSSLFTTDCSKLMFKSSSESTTCSSSYSSSSRNQSKSKSTQETVSRTLKELQKLIASTKI